MMLDRARSGTHVSTDRPAQQVNRETNARAIETGPTFSTRKLRHALLVPRWSSAMAGVVMTSAEPQGGGDKDVAG